MNVVSLKNYRSSGQLQQERQHDENVHIYQEKGLSPVSHKDYVKAYMKLLSASEHGVNEINYHDCK